MTAFQIKQFGKYLLIDKIGTGGMAEVYIGKMTGDEGFEKLLVIKKILPQLAREKLLVEHFIDEAKIAALLQHENIIHVYDFGNIEDSYFIAMEYLSGKDLEQVIKRSSESESHFVLEIILYIVSKICDGLDYAHKLKNLQGEALNIIHRDISPQNIFITYDGHVKIIDFGIAKTAVQSTKTQEGLAKGKLAYMSPEQAGGQEIDHRSDIFSIGIILYELVTSRRMFEGETLEVFSRVIKADFEPPENIITELPQKLINILHKSLAKNPDHRYQSCSEMLSDIEDFLYDRSLRPTARTMSQFMESLFENEFHSEKKQIVEAMKYTKPKKTGADIDSPIKNKKEYEKTVVLDTSHKESSYVTQENSGQERERAEEFSPPVMLFQDKIKLLIEDKRNRVIIALFILGILVAFGYLTKDKVPQSMIITDHIGLSTSKEIKEFLLLAKESLVADRLTTPPEANAYHYYNEVLRLDPENREAEQGIKEIANRCAVLAEKQMEQFQYEKANTYIEKGLTISPDHPKLLALKEENSRKLPKKILKSFKSIFQ